MPPPPQMGMLCLPSVLWASVYKPQTVSTPQQKLPYETLVCDWLILHLQGGRTARVTFHARPISKRGEKSINAARKVLVWVRL